MPDPVLVVDLDGTILHGNSYQAWVKYLLFGAFEHLSPFARLRLRLETARRLVGRKLLRWPHARVKAELRQLWSATIAADADARDLAALLDQLDADIRPWFRPVLAEMARLGCDAVLATAAAGEYAAPFARRLGFPEVLATTSDPRQYQENLGVTKAQAVVDLIGARGWSGRPLLVFTDHHDDLPLIGLATGLVWFGDPAALPAIVDAVPGLRALAAGERDGLSVFDYFGDMLDSRKIRGDAIV